jgi:periplasmic divalent cation tolerance protein
MDQDVPAVLRGVSETHDHPVVVLTTTSSRDEAAAIAASLVERRYAACVQIVPQIESFYRWEGKVANDTEWLLLCKTTAGRYEEVERAIRELHSYTVPEVVALAIERGSSDYLEWLRRSVV